MTHHQTQMPEAHGTPLSYAIGFFLSILLTVAAYFSVVNGWFTGSTLILAIVVLAIVQLFVQLILFLHLGDEHKPRWNFLAFYFAFLVVLILVFGSLWIMKNLDYSTSNPATSTYLLNDEGIKK